MTTMIDEPRAAPPLPPARGPRRRPAPPSRPWPRVLALAALLAAAAVVAYLLTRSSADRYRLDFQNAGQLVVGDLVRIGGTPAGTVQGISLTDDGQAQVTISLDASFGPLRRGTTATIRNPGLSDVANRYLDISPAPTDRPPLPGDAIIPETDTNGIVDVDEVFNSLNANTREGLRRLIRGFGTWYAGQGAAANSTAHYLPPALQSYTRLFDQVNADTPSLERFISQTSRALGAVDARAPALTDLIGRARTTVDALGSDNRSLSAGLAQLPPALRRGTTVLTRLRTGALPALSRLVDATSRSTGPLAQVLPRLDPVLSEAGPTFTLLRDVLDRPGPDNDLYDALTVLPQVAAQVNGDFPRAITALHKATPIFAYARPYFPDLVAWLVNWDGIFSPYDANGHYARTLPVFDAYQLGGGGQLTPTSPALRGSAGLRTGLMARCPGSAAVTGDGSAPFVDSGAQANSHCRASESAGAAR